MHACMLDASTYSAACLQQYGQTFLEASTAIRIDVRACAYRDEAIAHRAGRWHIDYTCILHTCMVCIPRDLSSTKANRSDGKCDLSCEISETVSIFAG
jgi:hypothetical protein